MGGGLITSLIIYDNNEYLFDLYVCVCVEVVADLIIDDKAYIFRFFIKNLNNILRLKKTIKDRFYLLLHHFILMIAALLGVLCWFCFFGWFFILVVVCVLAKKIVNKVLNRI
nr:hypothetical protein [Escherichia albertii]